MSSFSKVNSVNAHAPPLIPALERKSVLDMKTRASCLNPLTLRAPPSLSSTDVAILFSKNVLLVISSLTEFPSRMLIALPMFCLKWIFVKFMTEVPLMSITLSLAQLLSILPNFICIIISPFLPDRISIHTFPEQLFLKTLIFFKLTWIWADKLCGEILRSALSKLFIRSLFSVKNVSVMFKFTESPRILIPLPLML